MSFVRLENLNDFIQPASACIKPAPKRPPGTVAKVSDINLSDCLACSGCITSSESVLVQQQNYEELFKIINDNKTSKQKRSIFVSLSLQSISSLAHRHSLGSQEAAERLASFFVSIGCDKVYDINLARHLALVESYRELKRRFESKSELPIISSICPGWTCYAEKTNGHLIVPHLSRVRSPQQIMGALLKREHQRRDGLSRGDIFHLTLMPCFDKKLEASRSDFKSPIDGSQDVDCVLTPLELEEILGSEGVTLQDFERRKLDILTETGEEFDFPLSSHFGSVSGGYAENLLLAAVSETSGKNCDSKQSDIGYSTLRNGDFIELSIKSSGEIASKRPKFAIVNGFRNIQTIVQRLKRKALGYDYIEIMACPSGCINGGAQCRASEPGHRDSLVESVKKLYQEVEPVKLGIKQTDDLLRLYKVLNLETDDCREKILYTDFHPVPKMQNLTVSW